VAGGVTAGSGPERQLIAFSLHGEQYALPIAAVQEIIRYTPPRATATARGLVQGLINLRGRVLPVVDLSSRLGRVLEVTDATRILVVEVSAGVLGLIVDRVEGVLRISADRIEAIPGTVAADALGDQVAAVDDQLVMLVDAERALGGVLAASPGRERGAQPSEPTPAQPTAAPARGARRPRTLRAQGPAGTSPARRRSAASPQAPRSRRPPRDRGSG
jgi:purine-binding chemotaxis protein CheW